MTDYRHDLVLANINGDAFNHYNVSFRRVAEHDIVHLNVHIICFITVLLWLQLSLVLHFAFRDYEQSDFIAGSEYLEDILNVVCDCASVVHHLTNVKHYSCHLTYGEIELLVSLCNEVNDGEGTQMIHSLVAKEVNRPVVAPGTPNLKHTLVNRSKAQKGHLLVGEGLDGADVRDGLATYGTHLASLLLQANKEYGQVVSAPPMDNNLRCDPADHYREQPRVIGGCKNDTSEADAG